MQCSPVALTLLCWAHHGCHSAQPIWLLHRNVFCHAGSPEIRGVSVFSRLCHDLCRPRMAIANFLLALSPAAAFNGHASLLSGCTTGRSSVQMSFSKPEQNLPLHDAQTRASSKARAAFTAAANAESPFVLNLAALVACEERVSDDPRLVFQEIDLQLEKLVRSARTRLSLGSVLGADTSSPEAIARCVSQTLFGRRDGMENDVDPAFFEGSRGSYYDPRNSFIDVVLRRRLGVPISLSLVYAEVCAQLGCPMVGLNAPMHLLIAPADKTLPFVIDPFDDGKILSIEEASAMIAVKRGMATFERGPLSTQQGMMHLLMLRRSPMTAQMWCARMLRNLQGIHAAENDLVRTLGAAERLRIIAKKHPEVSSDREQLLCAMQIAQCISALDWKERRAEAKQLLMKELQNEELPSDTRQQLEALLESFTRAPDS